MKGVILAGGIGSRLWPLTKITNKHLLPVGKYPMIYYCISKIRECGIDEIMIVSGEEHVGDIISLLGSGHSFDVDLTYKIQDKAGGIAQALGICQAFVGDEKCLVILGDNIFSDNINRYVDRFKEQEKGAKILIKQVEDPNRYGIAEFSEDKVISIEEKPINPKSNYCVTGIYMYDNRVFEVIKTLKPSSRGELEITDVNNWYIKDGSMTFDILNGWWIDAGTFESLTEASNLTKNVFLGDRFGGK